MKTKATSQVIFFAFLIALSNILHAQVAEQDSLALVDFYNSTNGANWDYNYNWLSDEVSYWYGVHTGSGSGTLRVVDIDLRSNNLVGPIPSTFWNLSGLIWLDLNQNHLSGTIPSSIGNLTNLIKLDLNINSLEGNIPSEIGNLVNLTSLNLWSNYFSGNIPETIGALQNLEGLALGNYLTGTIPSSIGNLTKLTNLHLESNQLESPIPATISNLTKLIALKLEFNKFSGEIPSVIGDLTNLQWLDLSNNQFTGTIPTSFNKLVNVTTFKAGYNQLSGELPITALGGMTNLTSLDLSSNGFEGEIPSQINLLQNLTELDLSGNSFTGSLPTAIGDLTNLKYLYLNSNKLESIPEEINNLSNLLGLVLDYNSLTDLPNLQGLNKLEILRIQNNRLTFENIIPVLNAAQYVYYSPQDSVGTEINEIVKIGDPVIMNANVGGNGNQYQWTKNRIDILGATNSDFTITHVKVEDSGMYICRITNPLAPDLTLYTRPFFLNKGVIKPLKDSLFIADEQDTIKWYLNAYRVTISLSVDGGTTYNKVIASDIQNTGKYVWQQVDATPWSRKCKIKIEDAANPNNVIYSDLFKIKGYALSRITPDGQYEFFLTLRDGWQFKNTKENMWPEQWWQQFDYENGTDPSTKQTYEKIFTSPFINAIPSNFTDWPLFVRAFGENECYYSINPVHINPKALKLWKGWKEKWIGSCYGFAISSLWAFDDKNKFRQIFPEVPDFETLYDIELNDDIRDVINLLWERQMGKVQWDIIVQKWLNDTPNKTFNDLREMFLTEQRDDKALWFQNKLPPPRRGAHVVTPYRISKTNQPGKFKVYIYDSNNPGPNRTMTFDTLQNTWSYDGYIDWAGNKKILLTVPVSVHDNASISKISVWQDKYLHNNFVSEGFIEFYNTTNAHIIIRNNKGEEIGFIDSVGSTEMENAVSIIPPTGTFTPPIGYTLPAGNYSIEMNSFSDSVTYFTFFSDTLIYECVRMNALSEQTDRFELTNGFSIKNPDNAGKDFHFEASIIEPDNDKVIQVQNFEMSKNDSMKFNILDRENMKIINTGSKKTYDLTMLFTSAMENKVFKHQGITLESNSSCLISPAWGNLENQPVLIYIDLGNDGSIDDTLSISNQNTDVYETQTPVVIHDYHLYQNYPNPFNPSTKIMFEIPENCVVHINVYNILGKEVAVITKGEFSPGVYSFDWNGGSLASGIYLLKMSAQSTGGRNYNSVKKIVLLK